MAHFAVSTGCTLIAEGIETAAERDAVRRLGVKAGQGYLLGRPAPVAAWAERPPPVAIVAAPLPAPTAVVAAGHRTA